MNIILKKKPKTILVIGIVILIVAILFTSYQIAFEKREAEIRSRYVLWQADNLEVENDIKGYIDNIDWGSYASIMINNLKNPVITISDLFGYYGVKNN